MCHTASTHAPLHAKSKVFKPKSILFLLNYPTQSTMRLFPLTLVWFWFWACEIKLLNGQRSVESHYLIQAESAINRHLLQNSILGIQTDANGELWLASSFGLLQSDGIDTRVLLRKNNPTLRTDRHKSMYRRHDNRQILLMDAYGGLIALKENRRMQRIQSHTDSAFVGYAGQAWTINRHDWNLPSDMHPDVVAEQIAYNRGLTAFRVGNQWFHAPRLPAAEYQHYPVMAHYGPYHMECSEQRLRFKGPDGNIEKPIDANPYFLWLTDTLVVIASGKGIYVCDLIDGTLRQVTDLHPYKKGEVYCALPVSKNSFMLGTYDHGLLRLSFTPATLLTGNNSPNRGFYFIYSYAVNQDTQLLIPTRGLLAMDTAERQVKRLVTTPSIGHPILTDSSGITWMHDDNGIIAYDVQKNTLKRIPGENDRYDLFFEYEGQTYATSSNRIYKLNFHKGSMTLQVRVPEAFSFFNFRRDGENAWLLSQNGAYLIDRSFRVLSHIMKTQTVRDAVKIGNTWLWATYGRGLLTGLNPDMLHPVFVDPNNWSLAAVSLRYDPVHNKLWLASNKAIFILACDKNGRVGRLHEVLECGIHLPAREINGGNYPHQSINRLPFYFFASSQGLLKIPRNVTLRNTRLHLRLDAIIAGNDTFSNVTKLELAPNYAFLSLRIKTLRPFAAEAALSYRIQPDIVEWSPVPENHTIGPLKLPPGSYTLELRSIDGVNKSLQIYIPPYWYNTWAFRISLGLATVLILTIILWVRTKKLVQRKAELTFEVNQRTHELRTAMLDLEASRQALTEAYETREKMNAVLLHDIRSPLMFLTESAYHFNRRVRAEVPQYFPTFNLFAGTIKDLYLLATDFNLWLKLPLNNRLQFKTLRAATLVEDVVRFYRPIIESGPNSLITDILPDSPEFQIRTHPGIFKSIIRNLLDNSNKYTPGGDIHLYANQVGASFILQVRDSGNGLPQEVLRIYGKPGKTQGEWILQETTADEIGLNLILRFTRILQGRLTYCHDAHGSLFTLELPLPE